MKVSTAYTLQQVDQGWNQHARLNTGKQEFLLAFLTDIHMEVVKVAFGWTRLRSFWRKKKKKLVPVELQPLIKQ